MSKAFWLCVVLIVLTFAGALANLAFFAFGDGGAVSLLAFFVCVGGGLFSLYFTVDTYRLERETQHIRARLDQWR